MHTDEFGVLLLFVHHNKLGVLCYTFAFSFIRQESFGVNQLQGPEQQKRGSYNTSSNLVTAILIFEGTLWWVLLNIWLSCKICLCLDKNKKHLVLAYCFNSDRSGWTPSCIMEFKKISSTRKELFFVHQASMHR